ncbi:hypothetical protein [Bradyrhizobium sp. ARR65]|uniref:hypothetical protein n=1 Tax=Bradyrhizobium sp. ARR65 TaxID=1040989 RepID=UPI0018DDD0DA|nr:hypothetical protein [Bradyrhizobium sp. ARR65]
MHSKLFCWRNEFRVQAAPSSTQWSPYGKEGKEDRSSRVHQGGRKRASYSLEGKNACCKDREAYEKNRAIFAQQGGSTRHPARASALALRHFALGHPIAWGLCGRILLLMPVTPKERPAFDHVTWFQQSKSRSGADRD